MQRYDTIGSWQPIPTRTQKIKTRTNELVYALIASDFTANELSSAQLQHRTLIYLLSLPLAYVMRGMFCEKNAEIIINCLSKCVRSLRYVCVVLAHSRTSRIKISRWITSMIANNIHNNVCANHDVHLLIFKILIFVRSYNTHVSNLQYHIVNNAKYFTQLLILINITTFNFLRYVDCH